MSREGMGMTGERQRFRADGKNIDKTKNFPQNAERGNSLSLLGQRLERLVEWVGKDVSVYATGKSWKQLRRYFGGAEVPASVVKGIAKAAGVSCDFILAGKASCASDADVGRQLAERELRLVRKRIEACSMAGDRKPLEADEARLVQLSDAFSRRRDEFLFCEACSSPQGRTGAPPHRARAEVATAILARLIEEIGETCRRHDIRISPARHAEIAATRYADVVAVSDDPAERRGALKMVLTQIERDVTATGAPDR